MIVTKDDVLRAMRECDELGIEAFCARHGYRPSLRLLVHHQGRSYPSKAILGVAAGLAASGFSGGAWHCGKKLEQLGFRVRGYRTALARQLLRAAQLGWKTGIKRADLGDEPVAVFASGSNHPGEIAGFAAAGYDVGVAVPELGEAALLALEQLIGTDAQVFVDSGAFSEVSFKTGAPVVTRPITDAEWVRRLAVYRRLAARLGDQVHLVAPDRVGDQGETLARLRRYRDQVLELHELGAKVLVPVQKGALTQAAFAAEVDAILGGTWWIPALPMKKAATSPAEVATFVRERQPRVLHLLGFGPRSRLAWGVFDAIERESAGACLFTCDANVLIANVGRKAGLRSLTRAMDFLGQLVGEALTSWTTTSRKELGVALAFGGAR